MTLYVEKYIGYHRGGRKSYYLAVVKMSLGRRIVAWAYHKYDMLIPVKIPGWKKFEHWMHKKWDAYPNDMRFLEDTTDRKERLVDKIGGWVFHQDLRCFELSYNHRVEFGRIELTEEEYNSL